MSIAILSGDCREMTFPGVKFFAGKRLVEHIIRTVQVRNKDMCEIWCYQEHNCVSFNLKVKASTAETFSCELNNATHLEQDGQFVSTKDYVYQGVEVRTILITRFQSRLLQSRIPLLFSIPSRHPPSPTSIFIEIPPG